MLYYIRDKEGSLIGFKYNNNLYYYLKNMQEDIIGITDENFNKIVSYTYDPWGKIVSIKDNNNNEITDPSHIGLINPFRYRSYYYDTETKLYYINSRYYNPEWGRFINADIYLYTAKGMFSTNMYAYTESNPINRADTDGEIWFQIAGIILGAAAGIIANGIVNAVTGRPVFEGWTGAAASGAYYGLLSTTPLNYTITGQVAMNYGSAFINSSVNSYDDFNIWEVGADTLIGGSLGMIISDPISTNKGWYRPTTFKTSFSGNYTKKLIANQALTSINSGAVYNAAKDAYANTKNSTKDNKQKEPPKSEAASAITNIGLMALNIF